MAGSQGAVRAFLPTVIKAPEGPARKAPVGSRGRLLLYVHVPFCRAKCRYCAFHSQVLSMDALESYLATMEKETRLWGLRLNRPVVETVFLGGGTPSMLPEWALERLFGWLRSAFAIQSGAEITMEANPDSLHPGILATAKALGVNRLSLGVQSLRDPELAQLGRPHTARQALQAVEQARTAGFDNLGLDLIWGLPQQTATSWLGTLKRAVALEPEHLSAYGLTVEPGTPLAQDVADGRIVLPDEATQARMYDAGAEFLTQRGLLHYEISNFARMGYTCRHNLGYWAGRDYLGLGPAATSTLNGRRWTNPADLQAHAKAVAGGRPDAGAEELGPATRRKELVMLALRTTAGLSLADYRRKAGQPFIRGDRRALLERLVNAGLARLVRGRLYLTRSGLLVSDAILGRLLATEDEPATTTGDAS